MYNNSTLFLYRNRRPRPPTSTPPAADGTPTLEITIIRNITTRAIVALDQAMAVMPPPRISVPPGKAITGLPMYVVIDKPAVLTFTAPDPDLPDESLNFTCEPVTHSLQFGDEELQPRSDDWGAPYPNGTIEYVWTETGTGSITDTVQWECIAVGIDGTSATIDRTSTATLEIPIIEYRPVIVTNDATTSNDTTPNELTDEELGG